MNRLLPPLLGQTVVVLRIATHVAIGAATAVATATAVHAQPTEPKMEELIVTGQMSRYSALKSDIPIMETARSVSIESAQQLLDKGVLKLDDAYTYKYSPRDGTPATRLPEEERIPDAEAQARLERLIEVARAIRTEINASEVGRVEELLLERPARGPGELLGRTRRNKIVALPASEALLGRYMLAEITTTTGATFSARLLESSFPEATPPPSASARSTSPTVAASRGGRAFCLRSQPRRCATVTRSS